MPRPLGAPTGGLHGSSPVCAAQTRRLWVPSVSSRPTPAAAFSAPRAGALALTQGTASAAAHPPSELHGTGLRSSDLAASDPRSPLLAPRGRGRADRQTRHRRQQPRPELSTSLQTGRDRSCDESPIPCPPRSPGQCRHRGHPWHSLCRRRGPRKCGRWESSQTGPQVPRQRDPQPAPPAVSRDCCNRSLRLRGLDKHTGVIPEFQSRRPKGVH